MKTETYPCFGLDFLGQCNYDPTNPIVYFSIGQLIPLFIITIAVYQILNPILKLRTKSNKLFQFKLNFFLLNNWINKMQLPVPFQPFISFLRFLVPSVKIKFFYYLVLISIFAIFFSSIVPSIPNFYKIPVIGYPIFWEILSGLILSFLGIYFIKIISKPSQLNRHNYKEFFNCCLHIIDRREEKELVSLARELVPSLKTILFIGKKYEAFYSHVQNLAHKKHAPNENPISVYKLNQFIKQDKDLQRMVQLNEVEYYCFQILDLLSDKDFCKVVACKVPEFSEEFFSITYMPLEKRKILANIMKSSFENEDSILNRENQYDGLRGISNLTSLLFENHDLLQQHSFSSLISWFEQVKFTKKWQIRLYFSCLKVALKFSFNVKCRQTLQHIHDGFLKTEDILEDILLSQFSFEEKISLFKQVSFEIQSILYFINKNKDKINTYSSNQPFLFPMGFHPDKKNWHEISLYHILGKSIFDLFIKLSMINVKSSDEQFSVRLTGLSLLQYLLRGSRQENKKTSEILVSYIKFYINEENFKRRWYPALTKHMISVFGLYYPSKKEDEWDSLQSYILDKLKKEFHSLYNTEKKFALSLLPFGVSYDSQKKIITVLDPQFGYTP